MALVDLEHLEGPPLILEGSSAFIWNLLATPHDEASLVQLVAEHYGMEEDAVAASVVAFIRDLVARDLVRTGKTS